MSGYLEGCRLEGEALAMIQLPYSLVIEATLDLDFFGFYSPDLEGFTGVGHSIEDCLYKARWGMEDHVQTLSELGLAIPPRNPNPTIVIQNEAKLQPA
jgi:predicted RNase H-like HicB family nuclease